MTNCGSSGISKEERKSTQSSIRRREQKKIERTSAHENCKSNYLFFIDYSHHLVTI